MNNPLTPARNLSCQVLSSIDPDSLAWHGTSVTGYEAEVDRRGRNHVDACELIGHRGDDLTPAEQAAAKVLLDEGAAPGHSLHSWRCEHPDRYGKCTCVEETAQLLVEAVRPQLYEEAAERLRNEKPPSRAERSGMEQAELMLNVWADELVARAAELERGQTNGR